MASVPGFGSGYVASMASVPSLSSDLEASELTQRLQAAGIEVPGRFIFLPTSAQDQTLTDIKRTGFRIMIFALPAEQIKNLALRAEQELMTIHGWVWIVLADHEFHQRVVQMQGWLTVLPIVYSGGMQAFAKQVSDYSKSNFNISINAGSVDLTYSVRLYDAIMLYAHAATKVMSEGGNLRDGKAVISAIRSARFVGVGNIPVALDKNGDRMESYEVINFVVGADGVVDSIPVGVFNSTIQQYEALERAIVWPGNSVAGNSFENTDSVPSDVGPIPGCPAGQFGLSPNCKDCEPGTFSATPGMQTCTLCSNGGEQRYQPSQGMSSCLECPKNTQLVFNSTLVSRADCICQHGFWRPDGKRGTININVTSFYRHHTLES